VPKRAHTHAKGSTLPYELLVRNEIDLTARRKIAAADALT
jgi:hypothetical protein